MARIGVGVIIIKDNKILLGKKINPEVWTAPGGKLEYKEEIFECAIRETKEEVGIEINNLRFYNCSNCTDIYNDHYLTINILADYKSGNIKVMEPDKFTEWKWFSLDSLPHPVFKITEQSIKQAKNNKIFEEI